MTRYKRNNSIADGWSFVHFFTSMLLALIFGPLVTFIVTLLWEPVENFLLSKLFAKIDIDFGNETLRNSLSDIFFNSLGILATLILRNWI